MANPNWKFWAGRETRIFIGFKNGEPYIGLKDNEGKQCIGLSTSSAHWKGLEISDQIRRQRKRRANWHRTHWQIARRPRGEGHDKYRAVLQVDIEASLELCDSNQENNFRAPIKPE